MICLYNIEELLKNNFKEFRVKRITERVYSRVQEITYPNNEYDQDYNRIENKVINFESDEYEENGVKYRQIALKEYWVDPRGYIAGCKKTSQQGDIEVINFLYIEDRAGKLLSRVEIEGNSTAVILYNEEGKATNQVFYQDGKFVDSLCEEDYELVKQEDVDSDIQDEYRYTYQENGLLKSITCVYEDLIADFSYQYI